MRERRHDDFHGRTFCLPFLVHVPYELHCVGSAPSSPTVPQEQAFRANMAVDQPANGRPEGLLDIRT